jgi:hypothetical protein
MLICPCTPMAMLCPCADVCVCVGWGATRFGDDDDMTDALSRRGAAARADWGARAGYGARDNMARGGGRDRMDEVVGAHDRMHHSAYRGNDYGGYGDSD